LFDDVRVKRLLRKFEVAFYRCFTVVNAMRGPRTFPRLTAITFTFSSVIRKY